MEGLSMFKDVDDSYVYSLQLIRLSSRLDTFPL